MYFTFKVPYSLDKNIDIFLKSAYITVPCKNKLEKNFQSSVHLTTKIIFQKWVRFYRATALRVAIYTNNGIERQNNWLKSSYLERKRNSTIAELVDVLLTQFLPDSYNK